MRNGSIRLKTSAEVNRIRRSCRLIESILEDLESMIVPGITTDEIARFCNSKIDSGYARSSVMNCKGFPKSVCTSVNSIAAHGIPSEKVLDEGDIITVDISLSIDGWHGDSARTYIAGNGSGDALRLRKAAYAATMAGIRAAAAGNTLGDIGWAIERTAKMWGCSVVEKFAGHGIGAALHEDPMILPSGEKGTGLRIVPGMVFTVEPVLTLGSGEVSSFKDGWSFVTSDGSLSAQYEHTVAVFTDRTEVLTDDSLTFYYR